MRIFICLTLIFICLSSCRKDKLVIKSKDCKAYYSFLKDNWTKKDNIYSFRNEPNYWEIEIYKTLLKEECLKGLSKKQITKLFGSPTKTLQTPKIDLWIYCMNESCYNGNKVYNGSTLEFTFDEGIVNTILTSPAVNNIK